MKFGYWLAKRRGEVIRQYVRNEITEVEAVRALHALGVPALECWAWVERS